MGWTSFSMTLPVKVWFNDLWGDQYEVLDSALVSRSNLYGAIRNKMTGEVFCAVFLIRWSRGHYNFSYKDMTEFSGPNVIDCPKRIMKLLSPLNDKNDPNVWARNWRAKVEEYWNTRNTINSGTVIKTENPIRFNSGYEYQYFKKIDRKLWAGVMVGNVFRPICRVRVNLSHYRSNKLEIVC